MSYSMYKNFFNKSYRLLTGDDENKFTLYITSETPIDEKDV